MSTAIEKREQSGITTSDLAAWTREQVDLIKRQVCPKGITDDEFMVFIHQCQKTGMDPLTKEAFCVPRRTNVGSRDNPVWVTNHVFEPSADGMRARAARFPDFLKVDSGAVFERDECELDADAGKVRHRFSPTKPRGNLVGAWGRVTKRDGTVVVAWLDVKDRSGNSQFWRTSQPRMLEKCSEVAALRKAYPVHLGGTYIPEELGEEQPTRAESVLGAAQVVDVAPAPPPPPTGPVCEFGPWKGRPISAMSEQEVRDAIAHAAEQVEKFPNMAPKARAKLDACVAQLREAYPEVPALSESNGSVFADFEESAGRQPEAVRSHAMHDPDAEPPPDVRLPGEPRSEG